MANQCLENPSAAGARSVLGALPPYAADATALKKGRVLLLEDDETFREIVTACLVENGYSVVAVPGGHEGVREVMAGDFTLVLCDLMMPGLPGDMFYRAVERIRPALCQRFIFMSGLENDSGSAEFIRNVGGFMLHKPFSLKKLVRSIALVEVRRTFQGDLHGLEPDPAVLRALQQANDLLATGSRRHEGSSRDGMFQGAQGVLTPGHPTETLPASEHEVPADRGSRSFLPFAFALLVLLMTCLGTWRIVLGERVGAKSAEMSILSEEWKKVSAASDKAAPMRKELEWTAGGPARFAADRAKPRWTPVLHCIATVAGKEIELKDLHMVSRRKAPGPCTVRVSGTAIGADPRKVALHFQQLVEANLKGDANNRPVLTRLDQLEEAHGAGADPQRASFVLTASFGAADPLTAARKEVR